MTVPYNSKREEDEAQPGAALAPNPDQVNEFHRYDDSDNAPESHHHTIGTDPNQASPGDHRHNGKDSYLLYGGITVTGSRGGNAALASLLTALAQEGIIIDGTTA